MSIERQIANVYFDKDDQAYRLDVEYFDASSSKLASVRVEFSGTTDQAFSSVQDKAYEKAAKMLRGILDAEY